MIRDELSNEYFEWLFELMCTNRYSDNISYRKLLMYLHGKDFRYSIAMDENRADDGYELRYRYSLKRPDIDDIYAYLDEPCSVLEMMVALAIRCEEHIMDDDEIGDRTRQWFWNMVVNLGLGDMDDANFDKRYVNDVIERFLDREYEPDGRGGLFLIRDCDVDLRDVEIWYQLMMYLDLFN